MSLADGFYFWAVGLSKYILGVSVLYGEEVSRLPTWLGDVGPHSALVGPSSPSPWSWPLGGGSLALEAHPAALQRRTVTAPAAISLSRSCPPSMRVRSSGGIGSTDLLSDVRVSVDGGTSAPAVPPAVPPSAAGGSRSDFSGFSGGWWKRSEGCVLPPAVSGTRLPSSSRRRPVKVEPKTFFAK